MPRCARTACPTAAVTLVEDLSREAMVELLQLSDLVDLAIPRGGEGLIRFVAEHARVPVIKHYKGVCHLYVDRAADLDAGPGSADRRQDLAPRRVQRAGDAAGASRRRRRVPAARGAGTARTRRRAARRRAQPRPGARHARRPREDDYAAEFLDLILAVRVVDDLDDAIAHIRRYGSDHTEVIATNDEAAAQRFVQAIRSAVVMVNASSRFSDGGELGLGAEIGISTTRLHAYGPMGAEALTVERFVVRGEGQVRHPQSRV